MKQEVIDMMTAISLFFFSLFSLFVDAKMSSMIGINYGELGNNLPSPKQTISIMKSMKAGWIKLYDANPEVLNLLSGTRFRVSIMIPNNQISSIALNQTKADQWVQHNVLPYYPSTRIRFLLVGNEVLSYFSDQDKQIWLNLVPAMNRIKNSLNSLNIPNIKVSTPLAMDVLESTYPPSNSVFRQDISDSVMIPMLRFLNQTRSFFFIDVYPYFSWAANPTHISLDFALFNGNLTTIDPTTGLVYTNLLDQMLDSIIFAMTKLGYPNIRLLISETGWPTAGDIEQPGANTYNAATYNRNLIQKIMSNPPRGTPLRPGVVIPTFIFALFDENLKSGPGVERHWGLLNANGTPIYEIDLTGKRHLSEYAPLPLARNNVPYKGELWCVAAEGAELSELGSALTYACGEGNGGVCDELIPGTTCYDPISVKRHVSYAFSSYWSKFRSQGATCYFNGLAVQTTIDPGSSSCKFPSVIF